MNRVLLLVMFVVLVFCIASQCFALDIYTIKKDRVDQEVSGNRGYIMGNAPSYNDQRPTKRTLIAVDIELPSGSKTSEMEEAEVTEDPYSTSREQLQPQRKVIVEEEILEEDEYIK